MIEDPDEPEDLQKPGIEYVGLEDIIVSLGYIYIEGSKGKKCKAGATKEEANEGTDEKD